MDVAISGQAEAEAVVSPTDPISMCEPFVVTNQEVELEIDFQNQCVSGVTRITIFRKTDDVQEVNIDARQMEIDVDGITVDGIKTLAAYSDPYELMRVPKQWQIGATQHHVMRKRMQPLFSTNNRPDVSVTELDRSMSCAPADRSLRVALRPEETTVAREEPRKLLKIKTSKINKEAASSAAADPNTGEKPEFTISIPFRSTGMCEGLHFVGVDVGDMRYPHVYTRHATQSGIASCIFPCVDDSRLRNSWKFSIKCPKTLGDVMHQQLATQQPAPAAPALNGNRKRKADGAAAAPSTPPQSMLSEEEKLMEMTVVCSGNLTGEQTDPTDEHKKIMTFECKFASAQHMGFAIGPFEHINLWSEFRTEESDEKLGNNAAKIHAYCLPGRADEVRHTCAPIVRASDFFALEFAKYPFDSYKICFLEDMISETVAVNSMSLCSTRLLYPEAIIDTEIAVTRKLVHSLACQYLGVHIIPAERSDSWIVIGMQWFITDLFMKSLCGMNWYKFHIKTKSDRLVDLDVERPSLHDIGKYLYVGDFEMEFMELKAPLVLFILDQRMVKYAGCAGISRVISLLVSSANINDTVPKETSLNAENFINLCEKKSHYRVDKFWQQWVVGSGCPKLQIKQRFNKKNLNVDIQIHQGPGGTKVAISKDEFWREYQEELHEVYAGDATKLFTGPITIRIHEADGTPYEHYLDIKDEDKDGVAWSIPYNTKYKRLKKSKRKDGMVAANASMVKDLQDEDVVYFNMLGDVLQSEQDKIEFGLNEWEKTVQDAMDQESYEWIRFDCNFEWLCKTQADMPGYMYLAQLQQDRDVVAHQDAMLFFLRNPRHNMSSTVEARTLVDKRYFYGIRIMAASDLPKQCTQDLNYWGLAQLIKAFRYFFCYQSVGRMGVETVTPMPNDFSDKAQYAVQCAIPAAVARTRKRGRCSFAARSFLLDLVRFNDNTENVYSDQYYIAMLLEALTTSVIPDTPVVSGCLIDKLNVDDDDDREFKDFIEKTIETIERFRRMDEWTSSYHNIWTTVGLDCKMRLMKAKIIPIAPLDFLQYCQDDNLDLVRIKAWECLIELGMIAKVPIMKLLMNVLSTDQSPFVRERVFKSFCKGIAAIALGEHKVEVEQESPDPFDNAMDLEDDDGGLVIEQGDEEIKKRKLDAKRKEDISHTLKALKEELKGNTDLQMAIWRAFQSSYIGLKEKQRLLELCAAMFEPEDSLELTFSYPRYWTCSRAPTVVERGPPLRRRCLITFTPHFRTQPKRPLVLPGAAVAPKPDPEPEAVQMPPPDAPLPKKIKINSNRVSFSGPSVGSTPATPTAPVRQQSISVARQPSISVTRQPSISVPNEPSISASRTSNPASPAPSTPSQTPGDSIAVQRVARTSTPTVASPQPPLTPTSQHLKGAATASKESKAGKGSVSSASRKRHSDEGVNSAPAVKKPRGGSVAKKKQRIVKLRFTKWDEMPMRMRAAIGCEASIVATPARQPPLQASASFGGQGSGSSPSQQGDVETEASTPATSFGSRGAAVKVRKPLPTSKVAPPVQASPPAAVVANGGDVEIGETLKKVVKLKLKIRPPPQPT